MIGLKQIIFSQGCDIMGKLSRTKGHSFERQCAIDLRAIFPAARRHLENHELDADGCDLCNTGTFKIQCKRLKLYVNPNRIEEVQCDEFLGDVPVLITKADKKRALVVMPLEEWLRLLKAAGYGGAGEV